VLDIFCSGGELARACSDISLDACAIGYYSAPRQGNLPYISADLTQSWSKSRICELIQCTASAAFVWIAPPCGTLSFARERPLTKRLKNASDDNAGPLRSFRYVTGLPAALRNKEKGEKLRRANLLVAFSFEALRSAEDQGVPWAVFNPHGSYLWAFPEWKYLKWCDSDFDSAAFGSQRRISQRIRSSPGVFDTLFSNDADEKTVMVLPPSGALVSRKDIN
jgi:hypothetical protein